MEKSKYSPRIPNRKPEDIHGSDSKELPKIQEYEVYEAQIDRSRDISHKNDKAK